MSSTTTTTTTVVEAIRAEERFVGQPLKRREDLRFTTGKGTFVDDLKLHGMLYATILRSPYAHARIRKVDTSEAERHPGVVATLIGKEVGEQTDPFLQISSPPANRLKDYCMAVEKVRFVGEPVAAVVATDRYSAEDALELIEVEYEPLEPVVEAEKGLEKDAPILHEIVGSNLVWHGTWDYGDIAKAFKDADEIIDADLHFHRFSSSPLETNGVVADYNPTNNFLTIYSNNQMPMFCVAWISFALRHPSNRLRLVTGDIGGGFGIKITNFVYMTLVSLLSRKVGRPVKWIEDRKEHLLASAHGNERTFHVRVGAKKDGTILGLKVTAYDDTGAYPRYEPAGAVIWAQVTPGCYRFKDFRMDFYQVMTNKCPVGPNRGYSRMQHLWMLEKVIDIIARKLRLDPSDVRMKNYIKPDEMPYVTPSGGVYDGGDYPQSLKKALELIDYEGLKEEQERLRKKGKYIGIGFATVPDSGTNNFGQVKIVNQNNPFSGNSEAARVQLDAFGKLSVALGTVPQGQGHETVASQVVADQFGVDPSEVVVLSGFDSATHPYSYQSGTYASSFAVKATGAILGACKKIQDKAAAIAAYKLGANSDEIVFKDGAAFVRNSDKNMPLWQIGNLAWVNNVELPPGMEPGLVAIHLYKPDFALPDKEYKLNQTLTYSYQTHAAAVEVDPETGKVTILRYVAVDDCGKPINPMIVEGQVHGAAAHGIAAAVFESFEYNHEGQLASSTFVDYLAPSSVDMPNIFVEHMVTPSLFAPMGFKGVGEGGGTPLGAIANAVEDALEPFGVSISDSHQHPEKIYELIKNSSSSAKPGF
jgi:carbon-monoxide dehydrogenase large subunit